MSTRYSKVSNIDAMDNDFFNAIENLLKTHSGMSNARALLVMYNKIEALLVDGAWSVFGLTEKLNEHGFTLTKKTLKTELFRIRKKLGRESPRYIRNKIFSEIDYSDRSEFKIKILELFNRDSSDLSFGDFRKPYEFKDKTKN